MTSSARGMHHRRYREAKHLSGFEINSEPGLGRCLHRKLGGLLALEDTIDVGSGLPKLVDNIRTVGDQATIGGKDVQWINRRQSVQSRQRDDRFTLSDDFGNPERDEAAVSGSVSCH